MRASTHKVQRRGNVRRTPVLEAKMPGPEVYEQEYVFWPWGHLLEEACQWVATHASPSAHIVDYMCGTGFLLSEIISKRRDLSGLGCDISKAFMDYAQTKYPSVTFVTGDARALDPTDRPDIVLCTAGLHHLKRDDQPRFIKKVSRELPRSGYFLVGEELIGSYRSESERKRAVLEMFSGLMRYLDRMKTPEAVVEAAADMLVNEWCGRGEYKTSRLELEKMLGGHFKIVAARKIWPKRRVQFGDWLFVCQRE